jgi:sialic acid synthase SpsE
VTAYTGVPMATTTHSTLHIGDREVGDGAPCYVIAEACVNHNGDFPTALRLVEEAQAAGADAVKFQLHYPEHEMLPALPGSSNFDKPLGEILRETHLLEAQHAELRDRCNELGIHYLCTAYCREAADTLADLGLLAFKTGSGETLNFPLLRSIARHGRPMIVSTGMTTLEEVDRTVDVLRETGIPFAITHCTSEYPPVYEDINLDMIPFYKERYGIVVGHSDHTPDITTAVAAVALGAQIVEKHFTLDRNQEGPDHKVSIEPHELAELVRQIRIVERARGNRKTVFEAEQEIRHWAHHSVVTIAPVAAGEIFSEENTWVKRPGTGIPAAELDAVLGRRAAREVPSNALLAWDDVA